MIIQEIYDHMGAHAYVDGSFNSTTFTYGSGVCFIYNNEIVWSKSLSGNDPILAKQRNVAGEMRAAMAAVAFALSNNYGHIYIHYDYSGIENWVTGSWKRNNDFTQRYHEFMNNACMQGLVIKFRKVKAHSNDKFNDEADRLAKIGCGLL